MEKLTIHYFTSNLSVYSIGEDQVRACRRLGVSTFSRVVVVHSDYQKSHVVFKVSISLFTLHVATSKLKSMEWTQIPINENNRATNTNTNI